MTEEMKWEDKIEEIEDELNDLKFSVKHETEDLQILNDKIQLLKEKHQEFMDDLLIEQILERVTREHYGKVD